MKKRLFVALDLPESVRQRIAPLCCGLPGARWVKMHQMHLTLNFIGEVEGAHFLDIREELEEVSFSAFPLRFEGLGFFPPRGKPQVIWVGVASNKALMNLQRKISSCLQGNKVVLEQRKFAPHLTLARLKNTPPGKVGRYLEEYGLLRCEPFMVERFFLYSSVLGRNGAAHTVEAEYKANSLFEKMQKGLRISEAPEPAGGDERNRTAE